MANDLLNVTGPATMTIDTVTELPVLSLSSVMHNYDYMANDTVSTVTTIQQNWHNGLEGSSIQKSHSGNSGILTIIVILFVAISLNFVDCKKLIARFVSALFNNKKRENAFDEHSNHESRLTILTIIQYLVYGGIILAAIALDSNGKIKGDNYSFSLLLKCIGLFTTYYIFQYCTYGIVGYTFGGKEACRLWLQALNASQSLAGLGFVLPGLFLLFYSSASTLMINIAYMVYIIARFMFIYKGFHIFYKNIFSTVYFILYLCALEIVPLICVYKLDILIV